MNTPTTIRTKTYLVTEALKNGEVVMSTPWDMGFTIDDVSPDMVLQVYDDVDHDDIRVGMVTEVTSEAVSDMVSFDEWTRQPRQDSELKR